MPQKFCNCTYYRVKVEMELNNKLAMLHNTASVPNLGPEAHLGISLEES
jgi:hypothetical protein